MEEGACRAGTTMGLHVGQPFLCQRTTGAGCWAAVGRLRLAARSAAVIMRGVTGRSLRSSVAPGMSGPHHRGLGWG